MKLGDILQGVSFLPFTAPFSPSPPFSPPHLLLLPPFSLSPSPLFLPSSSPFYPFSLPFSPLSIPFLSSAPPSTHSLINDHQKGHGQSIKPKLFFFSACDNTKVTGYKFYTCNLSKTDKIRFAHCRTCIWRQIDIIGYLTDLQVPNSFQHLSSLLPLVQNAFLCDRFAFIALI